MSEARGGSGVARARCRACREEGLTSLPDPWERGARRAASEGAALEGAARRAPPLPLEAWFCGRCALLQGQEEPGAGRAGAPGWRAEIAWIDPLGEDLEDYGERRARPAEIRLRPGGARLGAGATPLAVVEELRARGRRSDLVLLRGVLERAASPGLLLRAASRALAAGGEAVLEVPYAVDRIAAGHLDTLYARHLSHFSLTALDRIAPEHGLHLLAAERTRERPGWLRVWAGLAPAPRPSVDALLEEEVERVVDGVAYYRRALATVGAHARRVRSALRRVRRGGARIAVWGLDAAVVTLLAALGLDSETIAYAVCRDAQSRRAGARLELEVDGPARLRRDPPDFVLLLGGEGRERQLEALRELAPTARRLVLLPRLELLPPADSARA
ncbi:MAG: methyltransferase domain-containing protein [Planctomycetota bacterium]